jgi:spermidine synthase
MQVIERLKRRNIKAEAMMPWHIEQKLHHGWQDWFSNLIAGRSQKLNSDFSPIGVFYSVSHWNALFAPSLRGLFRQLERTSLWAVILAFTLFLLLYWLFQSQTERRFRAGIPFAIFTTGFAGMIFSLMLIFTFQSIHGYLFSWIGLLVASFMAGAACGAMLMAMALDRIGNGFRFFSGIELAIVGFAIGCPLLIFGANAVLGRPHTLFLFSLLFLILSAISGFLIGSQFPLANKLYLGKGTTLTQTAGLLYASDLLGGWFGGIIGAVVLLPILGLVGTCITVGLLKLTSFIVIKTQPK